MKRSACRSATILLPSTTLEPVITRLPEALAQEQAEATAKREAELAAQADRDATEAAKAHAKAEQQAAALKTYGCTW